MEYDQALADMGREPLEIDEPVGPRRGRKAGDDGTGNRGGGQRLRNPHGRRVKVNVTLDPDLLADVKRWAGKAACSLSSAINTLLANALED